MPATRAPRVRPASRGFTLIEVVVVLLIFGVVMAMAAVITRGVVAAQKRSLTATRIAAVDAALVQFVLQQKRLPCPADGRLLSSDNNAGIEGGRDAVTGCTGTLQHGVLPWRTLALTETDATDGWDRRLTFRLDPVLGADNGMNMSWCDPAGTGAVVGGACNTACTSSALGNCTSPSAFLLNKGLKVRNVAGTVLMDPAVAPHTGAAYVVISPGESGGGGYLNSGTLAASNTTDGTEEALNYATGQYLGAATYYVDDSLNETPGATHFDDIVSRPSLLSVVTRAGLGPRSH